MRIIAKPRVIERTTTTTFSTHQEYYKISKSYWHGDDHCWWWWWCVIIIISIFLARLGWTLSFLQEISMVVLKKWWYMLWWLFILFMSLVHDGHVIFSMRDENKSDSGVLYYRTMIPFTLPVAAMAGGVRPALMWIFSILLQHKSAITKFPCWKKLTMSKNITSVLQKVEEDSATFKKTKIHLKKKHDMCLHWPQSQEYNNNY